MDYTWYEIALWTAALFEAFGMVMSLNKEFRQRVTSHSKAVTHLDGLLNGTLVVWSASSELFIPMAIFLFGSLLTMILLKTRESDEG